MRESERKVGRADHNPEAAKAQAGGEALTNQDEANDSADQRTHGAHGRGRGEEQVDDNPPVEPDRTKASDLGSSAGWGSASSGGSMIDKRPPK